MLITRKVTVPKSWAFYAQLVIVLSVYGKFVINAPFLLLIKKFIDNPAAIMGLISIEVYVTLLGGPLVAWVSDRIWTRFGRRKPFVVAADFSKVAFLLLMPLAPNLWTLIILRWLYGIFADLASPAQALVWEVVPAKQRGISSGYMKAYMNIGNLVFFTLLLGRFDDVYFMGPFSFVTEMSGGTLLFVLCALLFLGAAIFEAVGIKETYPPGRARLRDGRRPGEMAFRHFLRSVLQDAFARDLLPLYLLLFANIMFAFSLGVFQPLLFTEQWGYDLQTFGNNIAIGVPLGIVLGLIGGWMADRYGKMLIVFWGTIGALVVNILYTLYVYTLPDYRPSFWEIVAFGNLAFIFSGIKAVASGPLLWEYVARNRMGAATCGIGIFDSIFRNSVALFVGFWLLWWSIWFHPQAGYNVTVTLEGERSRDQMVAALQTAGIPLDNLRIDPVHAYGVDGTTSQRWRFHLEDDLAKELLDERKDLNAEISTLARERQAPFASEERRTAAEAELAAARLRIDQIEATLDARVAELGDAILPALAADRFSPGDQVLDASLQDGRLALTVRTLEPVRAEATARLREALRGEETALVPDLAAQEGPGFAAAITLQTATDPATGWYTFRYEATLDPHFLVVFARAHAAGLDGPAAFQFASAVVAVGRGTFGSRPDAFLIADAAPASDTLEGLVFAIAVPAGATAFPADFAADLRAADPLLADAAAALAPDQTLRVVVPAPRNPAHATRETHVDARPRLEALLPDATSVELGLAVLRKVSEALAARPVYVTVPSHGIASGFADRTYEYFFSSQILQIATDFVGIAILILIIRLERKGLLRRRGAEEDLQR